jgi:hypothetical protein
MVGELIRHPALRLLPLEFPTFPQAIVKKEKGPKRKKTAAAVPLLSFKLIGESNYKGNPLLLTRVFGKNQSKAIHSHVLQEGKFARRYSFLVTRTGSTAGTCRLSPLRG